MRYEIRGRVIDQFTSEGIAGVRVEAWDKDFVLDDYLASAVTISDGSFSLAFDDSAFREFFPENWPDLYFKAYCYSELLASTEDSVLWNVTSAETGVEIIAPHPQPPACGERHIYLKIERIENYSPVRPEEKAVPPIQYGRDCMRGDGHENGLVPQAEIDARSLTAVVYREYLDSGYLIPKPDKLIQADINEPGYAHRVPGTVIYTRPCERLKIHVWNTDVVPHSLHVHGLRYGIDSDGSWPFGTEAAHHGGRSDAICPDETWTYTFDVPDDAIGAWPFHDHTQHHFSKIDQGLFGGIVVLGPCDRPPRRFRFPWEVLRPIYVDIEREERRQVLAEKSLAEVDGPGDDEASVRLAPHIHARLLKPRTRQLLEHHLDFLDELAHRQLLLPRRVVNTDHVPVFFHVMSNPDARPVFDSGDIEELGGMADLDFAVAGDFDYFCRHHPEMTGVVHVVPGGPDPIMVTIDSGPPMAFSPGEVTVGVGGTVTWINNTNSHHTVTSTQGASMSTHCINGRGFVGNTPTVVGRVGQRIRWYVFNLDTSPTWHNFHPHAMRWKFGGESIDIRSLGPAESFVVESEIPPVLLLTDEEEKAQSPEHRPEDARLYRLKGDFLFHCHVHHHMMNGMVGLVRSRQSVWLTEEMAHDIRHRTGLPLDDGSNACPDVDPHPCGGHGGGRWEEVVGAPEVAFMHSVLLPNTQRVLYWGYTRADQSRVWDYSTPAGAYLSPANQPADSPGLDINSSDMWSAAHAILDTAAGDVLINGGFSPDKAFAFDPAALTWTRVGDTVGNRFYATTMTLADGRVATLYGNVKTIEVYTHGVGWDAPIVMPAAMNHHQYYPWTSELPDGRLFIAGPHVPTNRFDLAAPAGAESFATLHGDRSTGGEKGTSVLLILRPPDYDPIVYIVGGNTPTTEKTAEMINLAAPAPAWTALPDLNLPRPEQFTATLLPDGRVLIAGGLTGGPDGGPCEILDPSNLAAGWTLGPAMKYVRTYHSSFTLLGDGSILGGGDPMAGGVPTPHERFFPDYFDLARPVITSAPTTVNYGANFTINTPDAADIAEVVLLRPGATTHGYNMSQRGIELLVAGLGVGTLDVESPPQPTLAPPGWYLLFVLNASRAPSIGHWLRLTP